jgi:hypothetical protein
MAEYLGRVYMLYIDGSTAKVSVAKDAGKNENDVSPDLVLYNDAPATHTIPPLELARRSWLLSLLQNAYLGDKQVLVSFDDNLLVTSVRVFVQKFDPNFSWSAPTPPKLAEQPAQPEHPTAVNPAAIPPGHKP